MNTANAAARIVRNTLVNGLGSVAAILVGLVLTPFMIDRLGLEAYGVWGLAQTLTFAGGYASFVDLGVGLVAMRYIAEATADNDLDAVSRTVSTTLLLLCAIACVVAPVEVACAPLLVSLFGISDHLRGAATLCFALVGVGVLFEMPRQAFAAVLEGTQRYVACQAVELLRTLLQAALFAFVLLQGWGVGALGGALTVTSLSVLVVYSILAHRVVPGLRVGPLHARRAELRRIVRFSGSVSALRLIGIVYRQMDKVIVGIALGSSAVASYEIASKLNLAAETVSSVSVSALVPAAAFVRRNAAVVRDMFVRGSCYTAAVSLPVAVAGFIFARPLLISWIGPQAAPAIDAARLFLAYQALQTVQSVGSTMVFGIGRLRVPLAVNAVVIFVNLGLSILLVHTIGFAGVVAGTLIANALAWPVMLSYYLHLFETSLRVWLRRVLLPLLVGVTAQVAVSVPLLLLVIDIRSLSLAIAVSTLSLVSSLVAFLLVGVTGEDRRALLRTVGHALGRVPRPQVSV